MTSSGVNAALTLSRTEGWSRVKPAIMDVSGSIPGEGMVMMSSRPLRTPRSA